MTLSLVGGVALVVGAILLLVGNVLHPEAEGLDEYAEASAQGTWAPIHLLFLVGSIVMTLGVLCLNAIVRGLGEGVLSRAAAYAMVLGTMLFALGQILDGFAGPAVASEYAGATGTSRATLAAILDYNHAVSDALLPTALLLFWASLGLLGACLWRASVQPRFLGASGMAIGLSALVGYAVGMFGPVFHDSPLFRPFAALTLVWVVAVGAALLAGKIPEVREAANASSPAQEGGR